MNNSSGKHVIIADDNTVTIDGDLYANQIAIGTTTHEGFVNVVGTTNVEEMNVMDHIIPTEHEAYDLGSTDSAFRELYLSNNSLYLGNTKITANDNTIRMEDTSTSSLRKIEKPGETTVNNQFSNGMIKSISGGREHSLILLSDGTVWAFGSAASGRLGNGTTTGTYNTPVMVDNTNIANKAIAVSAGNSHSMVLLNDGTVWTFGNAANGRLGNGQTTPNQTTPVQVTGITTAVAIAAADTHSMVILSDGTVRTFGAGGSGRLGNGLTTDQPTPVQVTGITNAVSIAGGWGSSAVVLADGTVWTFGHATYGKLGNATTSPDRSTPVQAIGITNASAVSVGDHHVLVLHNNGTVGGFGYNAAGALGNGNTTDQQTIVQTIGITNAVAISAGGYFSMVLLADGTVMTFGSGTGGKLGNGTTTTTTTPVMVDTTYIANRAVGVATGYEHSMVLLNDGTVWTFGFGTNGKLGNGSTDNSSVPVAVTLNNGPVKTGTTSNAELSYIKRLVTNTSIIPSLASERLFVSNRRVGMYQLRGMSSNSPSVANLSDRYPIIYDLFIEGDLELRWTDTGFLASPGIYLVTTSVLFTADYLDSRLIIGSFVTTQAGAKRQDAASRYTSVGSDYNFNGRLHSRTNMVIVREEHGASYIRPQLNLTSGRALSTDVNYTFVYIRSL
jgi:alpha-tubulin suppressor-like RCC1 family protein